MINKSEALTKEYIVKRVGSNLEKQKTFEKVLFAYILLENMSQTKQKFIFKGGTSLILLLNQIYRFSTDIDVLMSPSSIHKIDEVVPTFLGKDFYDVQEDVRRPKGILKKHFKFFYQSIFQGDPSYILLDIVFEENPYRFLLKKEIKCSLFPTEEPYTSVDCPNTDEMLGDKLTAFAPTTIGKTYASGLYSEIIKQLHDVSVLYGSMVDISLVKQTYYKTARFELGYRKLNITEESCLHDTLRACQTILVDGKNCDSNEYDCLKKGIQGFGNFLVLGMKNQDKYLYAARAFILVSKLLVEHSSGQEIKPIDCFVGRQWKGLKANVGDVLYHELMVAIQDINMTKPPF